MARSRRPRLSQLLTVRLHPWALSALRRRARARGETASDLVRELIERELGPKPQVSAWELSRDWVGSISDAKLPRGARVRVALAEWNPDRR